MYDRRELQMVGLQCHRDCEWTHEGSRNGAGLVMADGTPPLSQGSHIPGNRRMELSGHIYVN